MTRKFVRVLLTVSVLLVLLVLATSALAAPENFPNKHVEVVTHSDVGGGGDLLSRQIIAAGQPFVPQPMVVVNKVGAGANNLAAYIANGKTDGHTLVVGTTANIAWYLMGTSTMDITEYLTPIANVQLEPSCFVVPASSKYQTMEEFMEAYKAGDVNIAGTAVGSASWLFAAFAANVQGGDMNYIPFTSGGELTTALIGGHVDGCITQFSEVVDPIRGGLLRVLAFASDQREAGEFGNIPTLKEAGYDFSFPAWRGYFGRAGMSPEHVEYWEEVLRKAHAEPSYQKWLADTNSSPVFVGTEDFQKMIQESHTFVVDLLKFAAPELLREGY